MPRAEGEGQVVEIGVTVVDNRSLTTKEVAVKIGDKSRPNIEQFFTDVRSVSDDIPHRIYWRVSQSDFLLVTNYLDLKSALNLIFELRLYVVLEKPSIIPEEKNVDDSKQLIMPDLEILRCITNETSGKPSLNESTIYTREYEDVYKKLRILMKGFPLKKKKPEPEEPFVELAAIKSEASTKSKKT